jgi:hypothetical protein
MNDRQEAKLNMFQSVSEICHSNEQAYAGVPAFANAVQQLDDNFAAIDHHAQQQSGVVPQGVSAEKIIAADILTQESVKTANAIYVYAFNAGDQKLLSKVSVMPTEAETSHWTWSRLYRARRLRFGRQDGERLDMTEGDSIWRMETAPSIWVANQNGRELQIRMDGMDESFFFSN